MENKFMDKAMDDMELDCVIGGAQIGRIKERLNKFYKGCTFVNI